MDPFINSLITNIVNPLIALIFAFAFLQFLWGMMIFIKNADNAEAQKNGKSHMLWGIVGLVIMFGVYGILAILNGLIAGTMAGT